MATHSNTVAWKTPWMEEPGGLQSMGLQSRTRLSNFIFPFHFHALEKEMAIHSSNLAAAAAEYLYNGPSLSVVLASTIMEGQL